MFKLRSRFLKAVAGLKTMLVEKAPKIPSFKTPSKPFHMEPLERLRGVRPIEDYQEDVMRSTPVPAVPVARRSPGKELDLDKLAPHPVPVPDKFKDVGEITQLAKDDLFLDGAYFMFSTNYHEIDGRKFDNTMDMERAALIIGLLPPAVEFHIRIKFITMQDVRLIITDKIEPVRVGHKRGNEIVTLSHSVRPGALVGIDKIYYNKAYPDTTLIYGLYTPFASPTTRI